MSRQKISEPNALIYKLNLTYLKYSRATLDKLKVLRLHRTKQFSFRRFSEKQQKKKRLKSVENPFCLKTKNTVTVFIENTDNS